MSQDYDTSKEEAKKKKKLDALEKQLTFSFHKQTQKNESEHYQSNTHYIERKKDVLRSIAGTSLGILFGASICFLSHHYHLNFGPMGCVIQGGHSICETTDITTPVGMMFVVAFGVKLLLTLCQYTQIKEND